MIGSEGESKFSEKEGGEAGRGVRKVRKVSKVRGYPIMGDVGPLGIEGGGTPFDPSHHRSPSCLPAPFLVRPNPGISRVCPADPALPRVFPNPVLIISYKFPQG